MEAVAVFLGAIIGTIGVLMISIATTTLIVSGIFSDIKKHRMVDKWR